MIAASTEPDVAGSLVRSRAGRVQHTVSDGFDDLYRSEYPKLVRIAIAICGRRDVAEELVQDAMLKVLTKWPKVRGYENPQAFCRRVVINESVGALRRRGRESRALQRMPATAELLLPPDVEEVWSVVRSLPARQMHVVVLFYVDDLATATIASILEINDATVRSTLSQARAALKTRLEGGHDG